MRRWVPIGQISKLPPRTSINPLALFTLLYVRGACSLPVQPRQFRWIDRQLPIGSKNALYTVAIEPTYQGSAFHTSPAKDMNAGGLRKI
jgi:hypothetical protein